MVHQLGSVRPKSRVADDLPSHHIISPGASCFSGRTEGDAERRSDHSVDRARGRGWPRGGLERNGMGWNGTIRFPFPFHSIRTRRNATGSRGRHAGRADRVLGALPSSSSSHWVWEQPTEQAEGPGRPWIEGIPLRAVALGSRGSRASVTRFDPGPGTNRFLPRQGKPQHSRPARPLGSQWPGLRQLATLSTSSTIPRENGEW